MVDDINIQKVSNAIKPYNLEALQRILGGEGKKGDSEELGEPQTEATENKKPQDDWRHEPYLNMKREVMIISSYGDETFPNVDVVPKLQDNTTFNTTMAEQARRELDVLQDVYRSNDLHSLTYVCTDFPQAQFSKGYYLDRIKQFFNTQKEGGAVLFYTGHGERHTGNWCFKDGVITFDEIFGLYMDTMRGKPLLIVTDCSYSGNWFEDGIRKFDEMGIPSCGHRAREQEILLKVFTSCEKNQQATVSLYANKIASITEEQANGYIYYAGGTYGSGMQFARYANFFIICCNRKHDEQCQVVSADFTWADRIINGIRLYLVRGKDKGKPAWHYVMVDEEKIDAFKEKVKSGTIDVAEYGTVFKSGWGEDPPPSVKKQMDQKFKSFFPQD